MSAQVTVVEVGPRDGLQNERVVLDVATKAAYVERLVAAGLHRIEVVSFVDPVRVPQMADAEQVLAAVPRVDGVRYAGLVLNPRGLDRALAAGEQGAGVDEVDVVVVATDEFSRRNQGVDSERGSRLAGEVVGRARAAGLFTTVTIAAAFGCPFEGDVPTARVVELARAAHAAGVDEIALADTIGVGVPADVRRLVAAVREVTDRPLRLHLHNTRNTGYANAVTAVELGVAALDASSGGIGGCPFAPNATGNIATEDLAYLMRRSGVATGLDLAALLTPSAYVTERLGIATPGLLARAGDFPPTG
jgi:hydroxymethylglutaryl-CoA lyase